MTTKTTTHKAHEVFLIIIGGVVLCLCIVLTLFPRSKYSELEKRDLTQFPIISDFKGNFSDFTSSVSLWFSDTEPFRDTFMTWSMSIRNAMKLTVGNDENTVTFHASDNEDDNNGENITQQSLDGSYESSSVDENAKVAEKGIIIVGKGENVRALMAFGGTPKYTDPYISACEVYAKSLPGVQIYAMVIPLATEFYLPERAAKCSKPQLPVLTYIQSSLSPQVKYVDAYSLLAAHKNEDIYLRTDHHWAPLGAYFGAKALAETAGVPFEDLANYERRVVRNYVGTMYGYSKDIAVKNAPEDFVYFLPRNLNYTTTYITYKLNEDYQVVSQSAPYKGSFFHHFKDGAPGAYYTFMGGDCRLVKVETGIKSNRKLLIVKDSYGNLVPGYLFHSFSEIHVVDFRYFKNNMKQYVANHGITDLAICFNIFNACSVNTANKVKNLLTQKNGDFSIPITPEVDSISTQENEETIIAEPMEEEINPADTLDLDAAKPETEEAADAEYIEERYIITLEDPHNNEVTNPSYL